MGRVTRVGITGSRGFLGWHLRAFFHGIPDVGVIPGDRTTFAEQAILDDFVRSSDVIVHLAGLNRGADEEIFQTNVRLTEELIDACERAGQRPHIIFASSIHVQLNTAYGRSKRLSTENLQEWAARGGGRFTNLLLPNLFGEGGRPFYNSVTATFCYQLANSQRPVIQEDRELELIHAQEVAEQIFKLTGEEYGEVRVPGTIISVSELLDRLVRMSRQYAENILPGLPSAFDLQLFNALRFYLFPRKYPVSPELHQDDRGELFEAVKTLRGGQVFLSTTRQGITRGNHYHRRKIERFAVVKGKAELKIRKLFSEERFSFTMDGARPQFIDIPTLHTHSITNIGSEDLLTLFWSSEIYDPEYPDTYPETV